MKNYKKPSRREQNRDDYITNRLCNEVKGKALALAYMKFKMNGRKISISSLDGNVHSRVNDEIDPLRINVVVVNGIIKRAWAG